MSSQLHTTGRSDENSALEPPLRVLLVTSELPPYAKAGGLGDMVSSLATGLARLGVDTRILMPRYGWIDVTGMYRVPSPVACDYNLEEWWTAVYESSLPVEPRVRVYLLDRLDMFDRPGLYGDNGGVYNDNQARFGLLSSAALAVSRTMEWIPHVIHAHDWPSAPALSMVTGKGRLTGFAETATVLTVHNIAHPGPDVAGAEYLERAPKNRSSTGNSESAPAAPQSALGQGISFADRIVFVSPSFAEELQNEANRWGFAELLNRRNDAIHSILNGIDYATWNPGADPCLPVAFDHDRLTQKTIMRRALLEEFGLPDDQSRPLIGMVGRLDRQKGFDSLLEPETGILEPMLRENRFLMVIVGTGNPDYEQRLQYLSQRYRNLSVALRFDDCLAHRVEAGSDFFLMPSRFEPCGLNQMFSLRYGAIPLVSPVGGLRDTVVNVSNDGTKGTGIVMNGSSPDDIREGVERGLALWQRGPKVLEQVRIRGMQVRFKLEEMAHEYLELYREALRLRRS